MADKAKPGRGVTVPATPDLAALSVADRATAVVAALRQQPGTVVTEDGKQWFQLEHTGNLLEYIEAVVPGAKELGGKRVRSINNLLGQQGRRRSPSLKGQGPNRYRHLILLDDSAEGVEAAAAPAPAPDAEPVVQLADLPPGGVADELLGLSRAQELLARAGKEIVAQRDEIARLTEQLRVKDEELARMREGAGHLVTSVEEVEALLDGTADPVNS